QREPGMRSSLWKNVFLLVIGAAIVWRSFYVLPQTESAIVTLFGRPSPAIQDPGLHLKWPFESLLRFDKRIQVYNPRPSEFLSRDKKNLVIDSSVLWRINAPNRYLQSVGEAVVAELRLHDIVWGALNAEIGKVELSDLVSVDAGKVRTPEMLQRVHDSANSVV